MVTGYRVRKNEYHDSVFLMRVARRMSEQKGILQAAALMGTEKNKELLAGMGVTGPEISAAVPHDLILAAQAESREALKAVLENIDSWLSLPPDQAAIPSLRSLEDALALQPHSNLAVISVPGAFAAREARKALERGLNVFLFSDHVPVEDERSLKAYAREQGLMVMGPDCGTAIIRGTGIGFANVVRQGPIGVIGASGTGIQEFTTLVHRAGSGISHAIGTGSRDLSDALGGLSLLTALETLESDPQTEVITLLSKPPGKQTLLHLVPRILRCPKPVVIYFLGLRKNPLQRHPRHRWAHTLEEAAAAAIRIATGGTSAFFTADGDEILSLLRREEAGLKSEQKYIRGIFAGGTFCYQAQQVLQDAGLVAHSNTPLEGNLRLPDPFRSVEHTLLDMGADEFTTGRPHPMIDSTLRRERLWTEAQDPQVAILLLDFILGFNSSPEPAGELVPAIREAKEQAKKRGSFLSVVASVCGTEEDPQGLARQVRVLEEAGVVVLQSSTQAARFASRLAINHGEGIDG